MEKEIWTIRRYKMAVTQLKDGRWVVYYRKGTVAADPDRTREYFGRGPRAEAAARKRDARLSFTRRRPDNPAAKGPTVGDLAEAYIGHRQFSENSRKQLIIRLTANILPFFGHIPAMSLTDSQVDKYVMQRRQKVKNATISRELTDLKAILNFAAGRRPPLIPVNPIRDYQKPMVDAVNIIPPTADEITAILAVAAPHLKRCIIIASYTGLRPGAVEMLTLTWRHVLWDLNVITIQSAAKGRPGSRLKPRRHVPLHPHFVPDLKKWYQSDDSPAGPIIHYHGHPIKKIQTAWARALARAGITRRIRPYDLRHRFITTALSGGADIKALSDIVGSAPQTLTKHYQHVTRHIHRQTIAQLPPIHAPPLKNNAR